MKYIILNDFNNTFKKNKRTIVYYLLFVILILLLEIFIGYNIDKDLFIQVLGLKFDIRGNYLTILTYLFNIGFFSYISFNLLTNDLQNGMDNIFLRLTRKKYIMSKIISINLIILIIKITLYFLVSIFYLINKSYFNDIISLFFKDYLYIISLQSLLIFLFVFSKRYIKLSLLIILLIITILNKGILDISNMNIFISIIIFILSTCALFINFIKNYNSLFE